MQAEQTNDAHRPRRGPLLPWALCGLVFVLTLSGTLIGLGLPGQQNPFAIANSVLGAALVLVFALVAALILGRYPRHSVGWLAMSMALALAITGSLDNVLARSRTDPLLNWLYAWESQWNWWLLIGPLLLILLVFPTGRLVSRRWRWVVGSIAALFLFFLIFATFSETFEDPTTGATIRNPVGVIPEGFSSGTIVIPFVILLVGTVAACVASVFLRYRRATRTERQQLKWFLYACMLFLLGYALGIPFDPSTTQVFGLLFSTVLLLIPVSIGISILRYRLYDIDILINRTLVYVPLTAILAGIFAASITLTQKIFVSATGANSEAATVLTTLIVVAAFEPLKTGLQHLVDRRFKEPTDATRDLKAMNERAKNLVEMLDPARGAKHLLKAAAQAVDASGGAVYLQEGNELRLVGTAGEWKENGVLRLPLASDGQRFGSIELGPRKNGAEYTEEDRQHLSRLVEPIVGALLLADTRRTTSASGNGRNQELVGREQEGH